VPSVAVSDTPVPDSSSAAGLFQERVAEGPTEYNQIEVSVEPNSIDRNWILRDSRLRTSHKS
jgi:hypothetical protein